MVRGASSDVEKAPLSGPINAGIVFVVAAWTLLLIYQAPAALWLVKEDGPIEWIQEIGRAHV